MPKYEMKIRLDTMREIQDFVNVAQTVPGRALIKDGNGLCVNAKSLLGVMASMEFDQLILCTDEFVNSAFDRFLIY